MNVSFQQKITELRVFVNFKCQTSIKANHGSKYIIYV